jgi:hypothetical protein
MRRAALALAVLVPLAGLRAWRGAVRMVDDVDPVSVTGPAYTGAGETAALVEAPGGAAGSIAFAHPSCGRGLGLVTIGAAAMTLTGGTDDVVADCPTDVVPPTGSARGRTTWRLTGAGAGASDVPVRLVVIDLPIRPNR